MEDARPIKHVQINEAGNANTNCYKVENKYNGEMEILRSGFDGMTSLPSSDLTKLTSD